MARPKKYSDKWIRKIAAKLVQYAKAQALPLKQDFASQNKFASQRMSEWTKVPEFAEALKRFEDIQQKKIVTLAMAGKINCTMAIFTLKNVAGWRDATEIDHKGKLTETKIILVSPKERAEAGRPATVEL